MNDLETVLRSALLSTVVKWISGPHSQYSVRLVLLLAVP